MATAGLSDLSRRRAAPDPVPHGDDRRGSFLRPRPARRALPRPTRVARSRPARARHGSGPRFYERIEPLAPAQLEGYRRGDLLARMVGDVDALQGLYVRGLGPPLVALVVCAACVGVTAAFLPAAAAILAAGLLVAGVVVPALAGRLARAAGRRQAVARGELTAELVELLRGAPELVVYGREEKTMARIGLLNTRARAPRPARRARGRPRRCALDPGRGLDGRRRRRGRGLGARRRRARPRPRRDACAARPVVVRRNRRRSQRRRESSRRARRRSARPGAQRSRAGGARSGGAVAAPATTPRRGAEPGDRALRRRRRSRTRRGGPPARPGPAGRARRAERSRQDAR